MGANGAALTAVVPAGGAGTRLWPISRAASPKFLHDLTGSGRSLLQATIDRLQPLVGDRVMVVTGASHAAAVQEQLPDLASHNLLIEPSPRDSMPAIGLAAAVLERHDPDAILGSFAADHVIGDLDVFADCIQQAVRVAQTGALVTLGITPTFPATGFGYIKAGEKNSVLGAPQARRVQSFVEKPDLATARAFLEAEDYFWNAGMFIVSARVLLELLADNHPTMVDELRRIAADLGSIEDRWSSLEKISIDHAVAEPAARAGRVSVVPAAFAWDDVGDFASLLDLLTKGRPGGALRVLGDERLVLNRESSGLVAPDGGRVVVTLGLDNIVVIDTPDALLVATRENCQDVKKVVEDLKSMGRTDLT